VPRSSSTTVRNGADSHDADWILRADEIAFQYDNGVAALDGVNLTVHMGEIVSLVGPSGCGKSTLLGLVAGLKEPTSGSIVWNKKVQAAPDGRHKPTQRALSIVFQTDTVFPWRTVEKNVDYGLQYVEIDRAARRERIDSLLALSKLQDFRKAYPRELSGGMRRRLAIIMAIAPMPRLLLLDEPFSGLDEPTRVSVHENLLEIVYRLGLTVVLVTHDVSEAVSLSDRVCVLSARPGRVRWSVGTEIGRPRDLHELRSTSHYGDIYSQVWDQVWSSSDGEDRT
jgi:NitT/TauT family transport system ATP-binding protein